MIGRPSYLPLLGLLVLSISGNCVAAENAAPLIVGAVQDQYVFTCGFKRGKDIVPAGRGPIAMMRTRVKQNEKIEVRELHNGFMSDHSVPGYLHWRLDKGQLLCIHVWISAASGDRDGSLLALPAGRVDALDPRFGECPKPRLSCFDLKLAPALEPLFQAFFKADQARERARRNVVSGFFDYRFEELVEYDLDRKPSELQLLVRRGKALFRKYCGALLDICDFVESVCRILPDAHYDFLPAPNNACTLFIRNDGLMSRWDYEDDVSGDPALRKWSLKESWKVDWSEPFYVHQSSPTYFFVTQSGQLHAATKGKKDRVGMTKQVKVGSEPLVALLFDPVGGRAFVFGKKSFLELKPGAEPSPCKDIRGDGVGMDRVLRTLGNCARTLQKQGVLGQ